MVKANGLSISKVSGYDHFQFPIDEARMRRTFAQTLVSFNSKCVMSTQLVNIILYERVASC